MKTMKLEIVTPGGIVYDSEVKQVTLPGKEGEFGVLPEHASLVSLLDAGVITVATDRDSDLMVAVNGGYVKVSENKVSCIVDGAVALSDEDGELSGRLQAAKDLIKSAETSNSTMATAMSKIDTVGK